MNDTGEHILALAQLQKLVNHATQPDYLKDVEFDHEEIINMLVLEKYLEHAKEGRRSLATFLDGAEWIERKQALDSKISVMESVLTHKRQLYSKFLAEQEKIKQIEKVQLETLSRPINFANIPVPQSSPESDTTAAETLASPTLPDLSITERSQLLRRRANVKNTVPVTKESSAESPYRREHDEAAADLVTLARNLKQNNLAFQKLLKDDEAVVKESELLLNSTSSKFQKEHDKLKTFRTTSWRSTKSTILMMFMLFIAFVFMYLFIKFT